MGSLLASLLGGGGGLSQMIGSGLGVQSYGNTQDYLKQIMQQASAKADPFAANRATAGNLLMQSYTDPLSIFTSPGYQALDQQLQNTQLARDAQSGNVFNAPERLAEREANFMKYLPTYQSNLMGMSGASANPAAGANIMANMALPITVAGQNKASVLGSGINAGLNTLFGNTASGSGTGMSPSLLSSIMSFFSGGGASNAIPSTSGFTSGGLAGGNTTDFSSGNLDYTSLFG